MPLPEDMSFFRRNLEKRRFTLISSLVPGRDVKTVLDAGCGSGWMSEMLHDRGYAVTALDIGFDSLRRASRRMRNRMKAIPFVLGDVYRLPFSPAGFDAVVTSEVVEHLENPLDALREMARVVRPGGHIVLATPYRERIEQTLCIHCNRKTPVNAHLHSFDEDSMKQLLQNAGFDVQKLVTFANRPAEQFGMAGLTFFLPYAAWRIFDNTACCILGRESFMAVRAVRRA